VFKNGVQRIKCPLKLMVACSNEWPLGDGKQELSAAFDRFCIRKRVRPISPAQRHRLCFDLKTGMPTSRITLKDLEDAMTHVASIPFTKSAEDAFDEILNNLHKEGINPGDRRLRKSTGVARAAAFMDQASVVDPVHLECLQHVLWEDPIEQAPKAKEIICKIANPAGAEISGLMAEAQELIAHFSTIQNGVGNNEVYASARKLGDTIQKLEKFPTNRRAMEAVDYCKTELSLAQRKMMGFKN
jgi:MoxR-like ATPase